MKIFIRKKAIIFLLDSIYIRFGTKLYRQIVGIPMGTNCAPLVTDSEIIDAFNSTSRYLYDLLNIDNNYFDGMANQIFSSELQLNHAHSSDTEALFLDLY